MEVRHACPEGISIMDSMLRNKLGSEGATMSHNKLWQLISRYNNWNLKCYLKLPDESYNW